MYTKEQLLKILTDYEEEHNKIPTRRELRNMGISDDPFCKVFGSYTAAKEELQTRLAPIRVANVAAPSSDKKRDALLEALSANLSDVELKALVTSIGSASIKPVVKQRPFETGYAKFLVVSDTHIGHSKFREDWWDLMVEHAAREGVQFALHAGDILEGMSTRPGHVYELDAIGFEAQFEKAKRLIGACPFEFQAIIGNHDGWYIDKADQGVNVGIRLEESLGNFVYLGADEADIDIENIRIKLFHGNDGASYATSYRAQKIVESLDGGDKPHILITGHDHKSIFFQTRNVHVIGAGTLCEQTRFMRGKKLSAHRGYWIVEFWSNTEGLTRIRPEWCAFY